MSRYIPPELRPKDGDRYRGILDRSILDILPPPTKPTDIREELAALCHEQWSGWMQYLFSKCKTGADGSFQIPAWAIERWHRQMNTAYANLPEEEKDNDRQEADKFLELLGLLGL